jgi:peptidoglycan/xylan/chitin deacetylase (PgdA/CDA1 family)
MKMKQLRHFSVVMALALLTGASPFRVAADTQWRPEGFYPDTPAGTDRPVALTFDDGLMRHHTAAVLDALRARNLRATFFVSGHTIRRGTWHLIGRMAAEGHEIANHSWSHDLRMAIRRGSPADHEAWLLSEIVLTQIKVDIALLARDVDEFIALEQRVFRGFREKNPRDVQIKRAPGIYARHAALMQERGVVQGTHPVTLRWFRPPGGSPYLSTGFGESEIRAFTAATEQAGVRIALWHHSTRDSIPGQRSMQRRIADAQAAAGAAARDGGIILAHDRLNGRPLFSLLDAIGAIRDRMMTLDQMYLDIQTGKQP